MMMMIQHDDDDDDDDHNTDEDITPIQQTVKYKKPTVVCTAHVALKHQ